MLTKTEAVNRLLFRLKARQVSSLDGALNEDQKAALHAINQTLREVLFEGWEFNTDRDVALSIDQDGHIDLPATTLDYEVKYGYGVDPRDYAIRDGKFYNTKTQTDVFTAGITLSKLVHNLEFEQLPAIAREYIAIKAERVFMFNLVNDNALREPSLAEMDFRAKLMRSTLRSNRPSMLRDPNVREAAGEAY